MIEPVKYFAMDGYFIIENEPGSRIVACFWHPWEYDDVIRDKTKEMCRKLNEGIITEESEEMKPYLWKRDK